MNFGKHAGTGVIGEAIAKRVEPPTPMSRRNLEKLIGKVQANPIGRAQALSGAVAKQRGKAVDDYGRQYRAALASQPAPVPGVPSPEAINTPSAPAPRRSVQNPRAGAPKPRPAGKREGLQALEHRLGQNA
jgi:hypothetical protein